MVSELELNLSLDRNEALDKFTHIPCVPFFLVQNVPKQGHFRVHAHCFLHHGCIKHICILLPCLLLEGVVWVVIEPPELPSAYISPIFSMQQEHHHCLSKRQLQRTANCPCWCQSVTLPRQATELELPRAHTARGEAVDLTHQMSCNSRPRTFC